MKNLIAVLLITTSSITVFAAETNRRTISGSELIKIISQYTKGDGFVGELDEIGGECQLVLEKDKRGFMQVGIKSDKGFQIDAQIRPEDKVKEIEFRSDVEGSGSTTYAFGVGGVNKLTIVHAEDAYDTIDLKLGSTSLSCGIYY